MLALFGILLIVYSFKKHNILVQRAVEGSLFCLFVATLGAVANTVQNETAAILGDTFTGVIIAGAIGGVVVGVGGLASQAVERLSSSRLIVLGSAFIVVGCFVEFVQIMIIFIELNWS
jgi:phosphatidylserine decarboxylase